MYRPHCVRSVFTTLVKILPYSPPARLIRTKHELVHVTVVCILQVVRMAHVNINEGFLIIFFKLFKPEEICLVELLKHFSKIKKNSLAAYLVNIFYISDHGLSFKRFNVILCLISAVDIYFG